MKIIKVNVGQKPFVKEIKPDLKSMQNEVGGLIEMILLEDEVCIICNEEGKINSLPMNRIIYDDSGNPVDVIVGDFFICSAPSESDSFESLPEELIPNYIERFNL